MGFNRGLGGFNRSKFNSDAFSNALYSTPSARTATDGTVIASKDFYIAPVADTIAEGLATARTDFYIAPVADTIAEGLATARTDFYIVSAAGSASEGGVIASKDFYAEGTSDSLSAGAAILEIIHHLTMEYSGALAVGKKVCINANNFTVILDGANAIDKFSGTFPEVFPVACTVVYTDGGASRTVKLTVARRDRTI